MKIKVTIKKESPAVKVIDASKAQKKAFKQVVESGKANGTNPKKSRKIGSV